MSETYQCSMCKGYFSYFDLRDVGRKKLCHQCLGFRLLIKKISLSFAFIIAVAVLAIILSVFS